MVNEEKSESDGRDRGLSNVCASEYSSGMPKTNRSVTRRVWADDCVVAVARGEGARAK